MGNRPFQTSTSTCHGGRNRSVWKTLRRGLRGSYNGSTPALQPDFGAEVAPPLWFCLESFREGHLVWHGGISPILLLEWIGRQPLASLESIYGLWYPARPLEQGGPL